MTHIAVVQMPPAFVDKLMPTNPGRMVCGFGDAAGLRVVDTRAQTPVEFER